MRETEEFQAPISFEEKTKKKAVAVFFYHKGASDVLHIYKTPAPPDPIDRKAFCKCRYASTKYTHLRPSQQCFQVV